MLNPNRQGVRPNLYPPTPALRQVFPPSETVEAALKTAGKMASFSLPHLMMAKEAVNQAYEVGLGQGLKGELRAFWATFATEDQKEGMAAFAEKRTPSFTNK